MFFNLPCILYIFFRPHTRFLKQFETLFKLFISSWIFSHLGSWMCMQSINRCVLERMHNSLLYWLFWGQIIHPLNSMQFNTLIHSKESGKKLKTFKACQRLKYEIHENLWNVRLDVYSNLKTSLLNHPWRISFFFIYLSFIQEICEMQFLVVSVHSQLSLQHWNVCETNFTLTRIGKNIYSEKTLFDPLLILYVCPLTKKWSIYNFNGRFTWTVRDRITTINPEKHI